MVAGGNNSRSTDMVTRHIRAAVVLLAFWGCLATVAVEESKVYLQSAEVTDLQANLLSDFVKLVVTANSAKLGPAVNCGQSNAQVCPITATAKDAVVTAAFSSVDFAAKFADIMVSNAPIMVSMCKLTCGSKVTVTAAGKSLVISADNIPQLRCTGPTPSSRTPPTASLPLTYTAINLTVTFKKKSTDPKSCPMVRDAVKGNTKGFNYYKCGRTSSKLYVFYLFLAGNNKYSSVADAIEQNLDLIIPANISAPCGSSAAFSYQLAGAKTPATWEVPEEFFCS